MPNIIVALPETYESITRPVAIDLSRQLMRALGMPADINLDAPGAEGVVAQENSTLGVQSNKNYLGTNENLFLTFREYPDQDRVLESSVMRRDNLPYFADRNLFVYLRPVYSPTKVDMQFVYRSKDEVQVNRWRDDILARAKLLRSELIYKVNYHHPVPKEFLVILKEIHRLRENQAGYGETFQEWIKANMDPRVTALTNQNGGHLLMVIPEEQVQVLGAFDFAGVTEEPVYNRDNGTWSVNFGYRYVYDKPIEGAMTYPLLVHQQLIKFRPDKGLYNLNDEAIVPHHVMHVFNQFTRTYRPIDKRNRVARVPVFDTWYPEMDSRGTTPFFIGLTGITLEDQRTILDLKGDLGGYGLDPIVIAWLQSEREFVTQHGRSLIDVALFTNDGITQNATITLTEDLVLVSSVDLDMRQVYHVRISVLNNLKILNRNDWERIRYKACLAYPILIYVFPAPAARGKIPLPSKRCVWTEDQWRDIVEVTYPGGPSGGSTYIDNDKGYLRGLLTVGQGNINAWREDHAPD